MRYSPQIPLSTLLRGAARDPRGDTVLAQINPHEAAMLIAAGGSGRIDPRTGIQHFAEGGADGGGANAGNGGGDGGGNGGGNNGGDPRGDIGGGSNFGNSPGQDSGMGGAVNGNGPVGGSYNGQGRGYGALGTIGGDMAPGQTATGQSAYSAANAAYNARTIGDRVLNGLTGLAGIGDVQPNLGNSASYADGTFHTGVNPGAVLGGAAGLGLGVPGLGMLGGAAYHALGGTDAVIGGSGAPATQGMDRNAGVVGASGANMSAGPTANGMPAGADRGGDPRGQMNTPGSSQSAQLAAALVPNMAGGGLNPAAAPGAVNPAAATPFMAPWMRNGQRRGLRRSFSPLGSMPSMTSPLTFQ